MSAVKNNPDNGEQWSIGQLKLTGVSVLSGHAFYDDSNIITTFEILELTDDTMVLCWNPSDAEAWTDATFWCLRKNNFNTHSKTGERQGTPPFDVLCLPFLSINYRK